MSYTIRKESAQNSVIMEKLQWIAARMDNTLSQYGIKVPDGMLKIWIKPYGWNGLYPKVEFSSGDDYELQYDIDPDGYIRDTFFKHFVSDGGSKKNRIDVEKEQAPEILQQIDDIIRIKEVQFVGIPDEDEEDW